MCLRGTKTQQCGKSFAAAVGFQGANVASKMALKVVVRAVPNEQNKMSGIMAFGCDKISRILTLHS